MSSMTIGEFAARTRLSPKALRLYDRLDLLPPAHVDPANGYRLYSEDQIPAARLIGMLRRLDMPLATIREVVGAEPDVAASLVAAFWADVTAKIAEGDELVGYLQARLKGAPPTMYDIDTRTIPSRDVVSITRHLHLAETDAYFDDAFGRLRASGAGLAGVEGAPYLVFYGEVSDDSDGPLELCRPVSEAPDASNDVQRRVEPAHEEAFIRLTMAEMGWPAMLPASDALEAWVAEHGRSPAGPLRQVLIADQRTADPNTPVCDLAIPLR
jgi:DNA-binding transcriptional MerR regulator